jgi:hypothetical protein
MARLNHLIKIAENNHLAPVGVYRANHHRRPAVWSRSRELSLQNAIKDSIYKLFAPVLVRPLLALQIRFRPYRRVSHPLFMPEHSSREGAPLSCGFNPSQLGIVLRPMAVCPVPCTASLSSEISQRHRPSVS